MRRAVHSVLNAQVSMDYHQVQAEEAILLVNDLLSLSALKESPDVDGEKSLPVNHSLTSIIERCVAGIVL